jgi:subtilase family serine protease
VRAAFNTELGHFVRDGKDAIANLTDVHVPNDLAGTVLSVLGLQTLDVAHARTVQALHPVDFPIAYNAVALPPASNTAVGIITVGDMTQVLADLRQFQIENGLAIIDPTIGRNSQYRCSLMKL